jgi:hypothetical protein
MEQACLTLGTKTNYDVFILRPVHLICTFLLVNNDKFWFLFHTFYMQNVRQVRFFPFSTYKLKQ